MDHRKLFHVLVVGGAMLGLGCRDEDRTDPSGLADGGDLPPDGGAAAPADAGAGATGDAGAPPATDAGAPPATDAGPGNTDAGELPECGFCPSDFCCVDDGEGGIMVRDGFMCCWGTSC